MKTFVLLLTFWGSEPKAPVVDVLDSDLSGSDCIAAMIELSAIENYGLKLSCEFDGAE